MKKRYLWLLVPGVLAMAMFVPKMVASPETRTGAYFAMQRGWMAHWPLANTRREYSCRR